MSLPNVTIIVADNGANAAVNLPQSNIQVVLGCAIAGSWAPNVPVATTNPATLLSTFVAGPLVEAAGLVCAAGGTAICMPLAITTTGTATAVVSTVTTSTSAVTVTLDGTNGAYDDYFVMLKCITSGTVSSPGIQVQVSLDAGRNFGPLINLTSNSYVISNTGITLNFGAGILTAGDYWRFSTTAPKWSDANVSAALTALAASQYALQGWGSMHLVGTSANTNTANLQTYLDAMASKFVYTRCIASARDALAPTAWGGSGETESVWVNSLATAFGSNNTKRVCVGAGNYNMTSVFPNATAGLPAYRRPLAWADAVRRTQIPPQRRGGRVRDGSLTNIVVNPATDPGDGFIYHDERINPGLDAARFLSAITWAKQSGFFVCHENLMSSVGSQFTDLTLGNVIDIACDIGYATGVNEISDDLRLTAAGTLYPADALALQATIDSALSAGMTNVSMVSDAYSSVSQTANVGATQNLPISITITPRGYVNSITETINLAAT